jgi:DNA-directed RNA polymerase specialized sigma24 family protein
MSRGRARRDVPAVTSAARSVEAGERAAPRGEGQRWPRARFRSDAGDGDDPPQSAELVRRGQRGSAGAVNELLTRYIPRLRRILCIKIPAAQRAAVDPEDVLQETLIVASRLLDELEVRTPASILQWLSKIADYEIRNCLEYLHAQKRDPARELRARSDSDSEDRLGVVVPSMDPTPSQTFARSELEELIDLHVRQLEPPDYREVILLRDYYEADWERIQSVLGRPSVEAVQDLYRRAQTRLHERIAKYLQ